MALLLSKDTISVEILSFGEMSENREFLQEFISKVNIDNNSHFYEVTPDQRFMDVLMPNASMEEQEDFDDLDLRRAIEESRRTYQMVGIVVLSNG